MTVMLLTQHHLEFLRLKEGYTGSPESIHVKMPHCWKSRAAAELCALIGLKCYFINVQIVHVHVFDLFSIGD